jgi:hypothetical protein
VQFFASVWIEADRVAGVRLVFCERPTVDLVPFASSRDDSDANESVVGAHLVGEVHAEISNLERLQDFL